MLALILDPHFKSLRVVESFVGHNDAMCFTIEYHVKEVILFSNDYFLLIESIVETIVASCDEPVFLD